MNVELIDWMGDDLTVVNAARVSMDKESAWGGKQADWELQDKDKKLIKYLANHKHWTPFAHPQITVRVEAPIFTKIQCFKHKVGFTENEISRRYVSSLPTFHTPTVWREKADNVKQGSADSGRTDIQEYTKESYRKHIDASVELYEYLLHSGVCAEQSRMVLPQSMMTEWYWTGSLSAFARFYVQRTHSTSQRETKEVALMCGKIIQPLFPESWAALTQGE